MVGGFVLTTKQNVVSSISGGKPGQPTGAASSVFYNEALKGEPRKENLFLIRILGRTTYIELLKDIIKNQVAATDFRVKVTDDIESPTDSMLKTAQEAEDFFRGNFNPDGMSWNHLIKIILDDILDFDSGIWELVPDTEGYLQWIIPRDGLTFTINTQDTGLLPVEEDKPAYYQFSTSMFSPYLTNNEVTGIDLDRMGETITQVLPFTTRAKEVREFTRDQIVWFSESPVSYSSYGRGRTQKVKKVTEIILNGDLHRNKFFTDNEFPKGYISMPGGTQPEIEALKQEFQDNGGNNYSIPIIGLANDSKAEWVPLDPDPEKMQFLESQKWYIKVAIMAYGANESEAGNHENANLSVSDEMKYNIWRRTTSPILRMIEQKINARVLPYMRQYHELDGYLEFEFDKESDFLKKIQQQIEQKELELGTKTINQIRKERGEQCYGEIGELPQFVLTPLANSKPAYVAQQINPNLTDVPIDMPQLSYTYDVTKDDDDKYNDKELDGTEKKNPKPFINEPSSYSELLKNDSKVKEYLAQLKEPLRNQRGGDFPPLSTHINNMKSDIGKSIKSAADTVIKNAKNKFPAEDTDNNVLINTDDILDDFEIPDLKDTLIDYNQKALQKSSDHYKAKLEKQLNGKLTLPTEAKAALDIDITNTFTWAMLQDMALMNATEITGSVKDIIKTVLLTGAKNGYGIDKMVSEIQGTVDSISKNHAELVARTETLSASRRGSQALSEATDVVDRKKWIATEDARTRPWHDAMDGQTVDKNVMFVVPSGWQGSPHYQPNSYPKSVKIVGDDQPYNCFDKETEILTENGWKRFYNLKKDELVYTVNPESREIELQKPTKHIKQKADKLLHMNVKGTLDVMATPEHEMIVLSNKKKLTKKPLKDLNNIKTNQLPAKTKGVNQPKQEKYVFKSGREVNIKDWCEFLAYYLADGFTSFSTKNYSTRLAAVKERKKDKYSLVLERMGFNPKIYETIVEVSGKELADETKELSIGASNKVIPEYVFKWDKGLINNFLDYFDFSDGSKTKWGRRIWTTSKEMADQLQHLFIIIGIDASLNVHNRDKTNYSDNPKTLYVVQERNKKTRSFDTRSGNKLTEIDYNDYVYCVNVDNGIIITRRNDIPLIVGNCRCYQLPVPKEDIGERQLDSLTDLGIKLTGLTKRQIEVWQQFNNGEKSFKEFWQNVTKEKSMNQISKDFKMNKTTIYQWNKVV